MVPAWYGLVVAPQQEAKTKHKLENAGAEVMYPTVERIRHISGKKHVTVLPMISRIIYARFSFDPQWHVMRERRIIAGVFCIGNTPLQLSPDDVATVMNLPTEAERIEAERIEAERPRVGGKAEIIDGPFSGFFVDVTRVEAGRVWYELLGDLRIKGEASEAAIRRVV